jgi:hypothetical protein
LLDQGLRIDGGFDPWALVLEQRNQVFNIVQIFERWSLVVTGADFPPSMLCGVDR